MYSRAGSIGVFTVFHEKRPKRSNWGLLFLSKGHLTFFSNKAPRFLWGAKPKIGHLVVDSERSSFHLYLKACRPDRPNMEFVRAMKNQIPFQVFHKFKHYS